MEPSLHPASSPYVISNSRDSASVWHLHLPPVPKMSPKLDLHHYTKISFSTLEKLLSTRSLVKDFSQVFQISVWQAAYRDFFFNIHSLIIHVLKNLKNDPINTSDIMPRTNFILNRTLFHNRLSVAFLLLT